MCLWLHVGVFVCLLTCFYICVFFFFLFSAEQLPYHILALNICLDVFYLHSKSHLQRPKQQHLHVVTDWAEHYSMCGTQTEYSYKMNQAGLSMCATFPYTTFFLYILFCFFPLWNEITCGYLNYWFPSCWFPIHMPHVRILLDVLETKEIFFIKE